MNGKQFRTMIVGISVMFITCYALEPGLFRLICLLVIVLVTGVKCTVDDEQVEI